jgi:DNA-binding transcriptional MerR regulator
MDTARTRRPDPGVPIGQAAAILGTTAKAIRTYHARGLVAEPPRDSSGYRRYDAASLVRLARVRRLRGVGLSLDAIAPLLVEGDGGTALRAELRRLDADLEVEVRRLEDRRALLAALLAEGVDDPILVTPADVWEEMAVCWLRRILPDLTPAEELSERRFQRAVSALMPRDAAPPPDLSTLDVGHDVLRRVGAAHRAFHALGDAPADDPRVAPMIPEMAAVVLEALQAVGVAAGAGESSPDQPSSGGDDPELLQAGLAAALEVLPPGQRRVMEGVFSALLEQVA